MEDERHACTRSHQPEKLGRRRPAAKSLQSGDLSTQNLQQTCRERDPIISTRRRQDDKLCVISLIDFCVRKEERMLIAKSVKTVLFVIWFVKLMSSHYELNRIVGYEL